MIGSPSLVRGLRAVWTGVKGLARSPVILAIAGGALLAAASVAVPLPAERYLSFFGDAGGPTALFALGDVLGRLRLGRELWWPTRPWSDWCWTGSWGWTASG